MFDMYQNQTLSTKNGGPQLSNLFYVSLYREGPSLSELSYLSPIEKGQSKVEEPFEKLCNVDDGEDDEASSEFGVIDKYS